jgi:hypothetical protein
MRASEKVDRNSQPAAAAFPYRAQASPEAPIVPSTTTVTPTSQALVSCCDVCGQMQGSPR